MPSESDPSSLPEAEEVQEDEPIDLLSISSLATPEPELPVEPPPTEAPPPRTCSPGCRPPQAPTQPVVPETFPEEPPPEPAAEELPPEEEVVEEELAVPEPESQSLGFDPERQSQLVSNAAGSFGTRTGGKAILI